MESAKYNIINLDRIFGPHRWTEWRRGKPKKDKTGEGRHDPRSLQPRSHAMKPGDRVIWLRSPERSFLTGWRVQAIPGEIVRVCRHRIRIRVRLAGSERIVIVDPENVMNSDETG
jgi:hypothetical protein